MKGMTIDFKKRVQSGTDDFNNPVYSVQTVSIKDCLVAPITESIDKVEIAALERSATVVRVHLPKADDSDVSSSTFEYDGQTFSVIGVPVSFMKENTPTRWSRYVRAEVVHG